MTSQVIGLRVGAILFAIVCALQLARLVTRAEVQVAGHALPLWPSAVAVVVAGGLALWMWRLAGHGR